MRFISRALDELEPHPACVELFCADGYYSCRVASLPHQARVTGVDLDPDQILRAETISLRLGLQNVKFRRSDVGKFLEQESRSYDLVLCAGGLYHTSDPKLLLFQIGKVARNYVVLQSVVTLETEDESYFVRPAPGWRHGCRFTHAWLRERWAGVWWTKPEPSSPAIAGCATAGPAFSYVVSLEHSPRTVVLRSRTKNSVSESVIWIVPVAVATAGLWRLRACLFT